MEQPIIIDEDDIRQYTCDFCNKYDDTEVGETTGFNGETARVCNNCDTDGCDYNGWGGYYEEQTCSICGRNEAECQAQATHEINPITKWVGYKDVMCDDCYYDRYASSEEEDDSEESADDDKQQ
jgi:hypothetical protein